LLLYQLQNLVREVAHFMKVKSGIVDPKQVEIPIQDFEAKVCVAQLQLEPTAEKEVADDAPLCTCVRVL
jgi:hypothetical protein